MKSINSDFNKFFLCKKNFFFTKKFFFVKYSKFSCFLKQNYIPNKKKIHSYYYNLFKQLESLFGKIPNLLSVNLKYTNKKKRLKTRMFLKISSKVNINNIFFFLEIILIKYFYFYLKNLEMLKLKNYNILKETLNKSINNKLKLTKNSVNLNILFFKNFLNFSKKTKEKSRSLFCKKYKKNKYFFNINFMKLKINIISHHINYFFKLFQIIILNNLKINILMHKKFVKYKKILEKA